MTAALLLVLLILTLILGPVLILTLDLGNRPVAVMAGMLTVTLGGLAAGALLAMITMTVVMATTQPAATPTIQEMGELTVERSMP